MFRIIGYNLFRFEAGARPKHPEYATRELARRGDDGSFVTEGAVSFRFVERGDLVLVPEAKHDRHGKIEGRTEVRIPLPRDGVMLAVVPARLQYGRVEAAVRDELLRGRETARVPKFGRDED